MGKSKRKSRNRRGLLLAIGIVALLIAAFVVDTLMAAGAFRSIEPHFDGACRQVEGVTGAEDMVLDEEAGIVYMGSGDLRGLKVGEPASGAIFAYHLQERRLVELESDMDLPFHPHGLSLYRGEDGSRRLFVVNHSDINSSSVEIFAIEGDRLRLLRTASGPEVISANDVAAVSAEQFYVTNDAGTRPQDLLRTAETYLRLAWANLLYFDGSQFIEVDSGLTYANSVALSADGTYLYVTESTGQALRFYERNQETGALTLRGQHPIPSALDNLSVSADGSLWIAGHPKMLDFVAHASDPGTRSASHIFKVTLQPGFAVADEIWLDDGNALSGSSVALPVGGGRFLVGSVFEPRFLDCQIGAAPADLPRPAEDEGQGTDGGPGPDAEPGSADASPATSDADN